MGKKQSVTAIELILGSLVTLKWVRMPDSNVVNVSDLMLKEVLRLYTESFSKVARTSEKKFMVYYRFFKNTTYAYTSSNEVKGYCMYCIVLSISSTGLKRTAILDTLTVDSKYRGQGIGTSLLQKSILEMQLNSIDNVLLYVATDNDAAINLYKKAGFVITGITTGMCDLGKECYKMEIFLN